jgi:hypothetical protein
MDKPHYNIVIATPGHSMLSHYVKSLVETMKWMDSKRLTYHFVSKFSSFVPSAREQTATGTDGHDWETREFGAGEYTYDKIVWIDSDVCWNVEAFEQLISHDLDIVSGMMPIDQQGRISATIINEMGHPTVINALQFMLAADPIQVDGVGFGFLAVRSGVFERMPRPWFKIRQTRIEGAMFPVNFGEDYSWCESATEAGFQIWVDPTVKVEHFKQFALHL